MKDFQIFFFEDNNESIMMKNITFTCKKICHQHISNSYDINSIEDFEDISKEIL